MSLFTAALVLLQVTALPAPPDSVVIRVGTRPVAVLRASLGGRSLASRAAAANRRIEIAVREGADSVVTNPLGDAVIVSAGIHPLFLIAPADVDTAGGETVEAAAARSAEQVRLALAERREARSVRALLLDAVLTLVATIVLVLGLRVIGWGERRVAGLAEGEARRRATQGVVILGADRLTRYLRAPVRTVAWLLRLLAVYVFLSTVFNLFPWTRPWGERLGGFLVTTAGRVGWGLVRGIPDLFTVLVILVAARIVVRCLQLLFEAIERGTVQLPGIHPETSAPTRRLATAFVWIVAIAVAYPHLPGSSSDAFKGLSVLVGLVVSLGSAGVVNQMMSGLTLMYARALRQGDYVRIGDVEGTVVELGLLSTKLRTPKNVQVTIPNAVVMGGGTTNYTRLHGESGTVVHTSVTIGYDAPWRQVHAMLLEAAGRTAGLLREPAPYVLQRALSDFSVEYELNARIERPEERVRVLSTMHANIQDAFNARGVQIMSPHFEQQPDRAVVVPPERWHEPPARGP